jgi:hypothetical protein
MRRAVVYPIVYDVAESHAAKVICRPGLIRLELTHSVFAGERTFGAAGQYAQLAGRAFFALE